MQKYNVHLPKGRSFNVYRPELGRNVTYKAGMFVPVEVLQQNYREIDRTLAVGQARVVLEVSWGSLVDEYDDAVIDAALDFEDRLFKNVRFIHAAFEDHGVIARKTSGMYREVMRELTEEYRSQIMDSKLRPQESGVRSGSVGNAQGKGSHGRLTGKIYSRIGGTLLKEGGKTIGVSFPDMEKLKGFQVWQLEEPTSLYMPSGWFIDDVFYPFWEKRKIKEALDQKQLPKIPKSLKGDKLKAAKRRRSAMKGRNTRVKNRKNVSYVTERFDAKSVQPQKPLEKAWLHVVGKEGEKLEERVLYSLDTALRELDSSGSFK